MSKAIVVVSFGTTYPETRRKTIEACEQAIQEHFPAYPVHRAFTSNVVRRRIKKQEGLDIPTVKEVLERTLYLVHRPRPLVERGDHGDQHIGVVLNVIEVKMVFVVIVGGLIAVEVVLQFSLQLTIGGLGPQHIRVLGRVFYF